MQQTLQPNNRTLPAVDKTTTDGSIPDDASSALLHLEATFANALSVIKPLCNTESKTFPAIVVTDIAIEVKTVTVTVCEGGTGATYKNTLTEE